MKVELKYDDSENLMTITFHGRCSFKDNADMFDRMGEFPVRAGLKMLTDIRDANLDEDNYNSISQVEIACDVFMEKCLPVRKALIVKSNLEFGFARMYEMLAERDGLDVAIFKTEEEAIKWLKEDVG